MLDALQAASVCIEASFQILKGIQFPETLEGRMTDAQDQLTLYLSKPSDS